MAAQPFAFGRNELQLVVLAVRIEQAAPRRERHRQEDDVAVELVIGPLAIAVDQAQRRSARDFERGGARYAPILVEQPRGDRLVHHPVVQIGVGAAAERCLQKGQPRRGDRPGVDVEIDDAVAVEPHIIAAHDPFEVAEFGPDGAAHRDVVGPAIGLAVEAVLPRPVIPLAHGGQARRDIVAERDIDVACQFVAVERSGFGRHFARKFVIGQRAADR